MVDVARAAKEVAKLTALKFFPGDKEGRLAVVQQLCEMATNNEQIEWVVAQMLNWYNEWPGPREMRGVFCQRWKPAVGVDVNCSTHFPDGVFPGCLAAAPPREIMRRAEARQLLAGVMAELPAATKPPAKREAAQPVAARQIGQAEIDEAVRAVRERRARKELGQ